MTEEGAGHPAKTAGPSTAPLRGFAQDDTLGGVGFVHPTLRDAKDGAPGPGLVRVRCRKADSSAARRSDNQKAAGWSDGEGGLLFGEAHAAGCGEGGVAECAEEGDGGADSEGDGEGVGAVEEPAGDDGCGGGDHEAGEVLERRERGDVAHGADGLDVS